MAPRPRSTIFIFNVMNFLVFFSQQPASLDGTGEVSCNKGNSVFFWCGSQTSQSSSYSSIFLLQLRAYKCNYTNFKQAREIIQSTNIHTAGEMVVVIVNTCIFMSTRKWTMTYVIIRACYDKALPPAQPSPLSLEGLSALQKSSCDRLRDWVRTTVWQTTIS